MLPLSKQKCFRPSKCVCVIGISNKAFATVFVHGDGQLFMENKGGAAITNPVPVCTSAANSYYRAKLGKSAFKMNLTPVRRECGKSGSSVVLFIT